MVRGVSNRVKWLLLAVLLLLTVVTAVFYRIPTRPSYTPPRAVDRPVNLVCTKCGKTNPSTWPEAQKKLRPSPEAYDFRVPCPACGADARVREIDPKLEAQPASGNAATAPNP